MDEEWDVLDCWESWKDGEGWMERWADGERDGWREGRMERGTGGEIGGWREGEREMKMSHYHIIVLVVSTSAF